MSDTKPKVFLKEGSLLCEEHGTVWCEDVKTAINEGLDAHLIVPERTFVIPIFPTFNVYTEVAIDKVEYGNSAMMEMRFQPEIGTLKRVPLGFWNPGEGMGSIRTVIMDYLKSRIDPDEDLTTVKGMVQPIKTSCPNTAHGFDQARRMAVESTALGWKWTCLWNIVMELACTPCIEFAAGDGSGNGNFGIDESVISGSKPAWKS